MSTHYVDIELLPDPEFSQPYLLGALYAKLHRALVQLGSEHGIGVSFPGYSVRPRSLGGILRLHGGGAELDCLLSTDWLRGMHDHVRSETVHLLPLELEHRQLCRRQFKTNAERLRRRRMRRKGETRDQAEAAIPDDMERQPDLPYVRMRSSSTSQSFCLFLSLGDPQPEAIQGSFNSYGLSSTATVPWF
ncbi:MAG TPA: type I-F CRISPR-associated endoribonuclease Cas6/Csy4 [Castellaniella sp.]|uniref:type I-F CRISPR-associated endoribonuclease Cas6/Csy4 n=1 Tax=Castellaniella sp. TaxID=1955812 RepID=UPI002F1A327F